MDEQQVVTKAVGDGVAEAPRPAPKKKAAKPKRAGAAGGIPSVSEVMALLSNIVRITPQTSLDDVVLRASESGIAYLLDGKGEMVGIVMDPGAFERMRSQAEQGR